MNQPSDIDDRSSDAHDTLEDEQYADHPRGIEEIEVPNGLDHGGVKNSTPEETKEDSSPMLESSRGGSLSTNPEQISDGVSVHSLPVVHVTEPDASLHRMPSTGPNGESSTNPSRMVPSSPSRSQTPQEGGLPSQQQRRARHRSAIEVTIKYVVVILILIILSGSFFQQALWILHKSHPSKGPSCCASFEEYNNP